MSTTTKMNGAAHASNFWASNPAILKASTTSTSAADTSPLPKEAAAAGKKSLVLKGMANGTSPGSTPKKTDWADSEDDDEFMASFSAKKAPRMTSLENDVAHKNAVIEGLEAVVGTKDARIQQLEDVVALKEHHISDLEAETKEKDMQAEKLQDDNHTQYLYVQELVAEVDEKNRRIQALETELDVKGARIRELEMNVAPASGRTSLPEKREAEKVVCEVDAIEAPKAAPETPAKTTPETTADPTPETPAETTSEPSTQDAANDATPKMDSEGPTINDSKFPMLWSPDKPKKTVPPVEKPKTLVMAIDMSKFGKKLAPVVVKQKPQPVSAKDPSSATYGQSSKHRAKTDVVPDFKVDKDIRHMTHAERVLYANGPDVAVMMGNIKLATLPKYVLMQCSAKAYKHFTEHPDAKSIVFPAGCMDADSAIAHLQWMDEMTYQGRVYSLTLNGDEKFNMKNLKICQAARVMGLNNTYVGHFTKILCDRIRTNTSSVEFLSAICELAYLANDPIFECLANNLVNQQFSKTFKRGEDIEALLAKYPVLKEKMAKIAVRVKNSRAADKRKGGVSRDGSKNRAAGKPLGGDGKPDVTRGG
ncbi:hypothetical protein CC86DRAFT_48432 [Ophiobolus disseminans]|uniref:Uncharacterized protein n=1 Tax=Ophiobolus disseminans TaxID=1469910 RepID=A0A6A6ZWN8_9PLEO|nr:hypothetical protein CC86DRAFT_48432 [Ophiobolus disseminans]